ncbi:MAG TPA: MBL fold metallo-hydrolase, partial [Thermoanaerobaculia bacterium]
RVAALNPDAPIYVPADEHFGGMTPPAFFANPDPSLPSHMRYFDGAVPERVPHGTPWKGANLVAVGGELEIAPGVVLVANLSPGPLFTETPEISLVLETEAGRILLAGCSHPGIERILESASARTRPVRLLVGGLHLVTTPRAEVARLAEALRDAWKLGGIAPGHCTGEHAFAELRKTFGDRYVYAGVGSVIEVAAPAGAERNPAAAALLRRGARE